MRISTKGRYAIKLMLDLATNDNGEPIRLKDVARRQEISEKYLEIIIKVLVQNQLLAGLRGKGGGYRLTKEPGEYTLGEILRLTEGSLAPVACVEESYAECSRLECCLTRPVWQKLDTIINEYLDGITLEDLIKAPQKMV